MKFVYRPIFPKAPKEWKKLAYARGLESFQSMTFWKKMWAWLTCEYCRIERG